MEIAGLQTTGTPGDVAANLRELDAACREARAGGAELLITTEMFVTGHESMWLPAVRDYVDRPAAQYAHRHTDSRNPWS